MASRRVVVTGIGICSPIGIGVEHNWFNLSTKGHAKHIKNLPPNLPCKVAGTVPDGENEHQFDWSRIFVRNGERRRLEQASNRRMSRAQGLALVSVQQAFTMARLDDLAENDPSDADYNERRRWGVAFGQGVSDVEDCYNTGKMIESGNYRRIQPYFVPRLLTNTAAGLIAQRYQCFGVNHSISTACTTGAHAIGDAMQFIKRGVCDIMIAGGTDSCIGSIALAGFSRCNALPTTSEDHDATTLSRPFDRLRSGFIMSEGAACLILEEFDHAIHRSAPILAEIVGYGASCDAYHATSPAPDGRGAQLCMRLALNEANEETNNIGYINAHATSTPMGDEIELKAIDRLFSDHRSNEPLFVSSTKGAVGHLLGGAGAIEVAFTVLTIKNGEIPPTINLDETDIDYNSSNIKLVHGLEQNEMLKWPSEKRLALTNSFGFGGTNASLIFRNLQ